MPAAGPLAVAGLNFLGGLVGVGANASMNDASRRWSERMYARQRQDALEDWYLQQDYNSPANMKARLKAAGYSPALAYGNVNADAGPVRSSSVEAWNPQRPDMSFLGRSAESGIATYQDMRLKDAQVNNINAQTAVAKQEEFLRVAQILNLAQSTETSKFDLSLKTALKDYSIEAARLGNEQQRESIEKTAADTALSKIGWNKTMADIAAVRAGTHVTLQRNEREEVMQSSNLNEAVHRVLNMRAINAKTEAERNHIIEQIRALKQNKYIQMYDQRLKEHNIYPGDNWFYRSVELVLDKLQHLPKK